MTRPAAWRREWSGRISVLLVVVSCGSGGSEAEMGTVNGAEATSDAGAQQPSCALGRPGMSDCGTSRESCCVSLDVAGGTFSRTYDDTSADSGAALSLDGGPTGEADPATVSSFRLDKYAVTVGRFREFVSAWSGGYMPRAGAGKHTHLNGTLPGFGWLGSRV